MAITDSLKKSRYNIFVPREEGDYIVFNAVSGAIGLFEADTMSRYSEDLLTDKELEALVKKGIYVQSNINEVDSINRDRVDGIFSRNRNFRIWSTSACNARCYYCFEQGMQAETMTEEVADAVVAFISRSVRDGDTVSIEWFGGEPLLNVPIIDYVSKQLKELFEAKNAPWRAFIISNGSLVTPQIIKKMQDSWNVKRIQITLDGFDSAYNDAKNYYDPTTNNFEKVIQNIEMLALNNIEVSVRMNYDTANYETLIQLIKFLSQRFSGQQNISYYIYPIWDSLGGNKNGFTTETTADSNFLKLLEELVSNKMGTTNNLARLRYRKHQCASCGINNYSILPNGNIVKCSEAFDCVVGNVFEGISDELTVTKWTDPGLDEDCKSCVYLPLCQGGCRASRATRMPRCFAFKNIFPDLLKWHVAHAEKKRSQLPSSSLSKETSQ